MAQPTARPTRPPLRRLALLATLALLAVVGAACSSDDSAETADAGTSTVDAAAQPAEGGELTEVAADEAGDASFGLADAATEAAASDGDEPLPPVTTTTGTASTGERIIKEGTVTVEVEPDQFDAAFAQVVSRAQALGGHVSGSSSSTDVDGLVSGQVTIRVPVRNFEDLLTVLAEAGTVVDRNITSQDVSEEFTDLESRRRHLQAQERFYLGLLEQAQTVTDAIAVQQQLEEVQGQIEQITGRLAVLEDRSSFSTLTVRLRERGAEAEAIAAEEGPSLGSYLETARDTLIGTVGGLLVASSFALPFLLLGAVGWGVYRAARRRRATPAPRASEEEQLVTQG